MARTVELYIDGAWSDVTAGGYVLVDDTITIESDQGPESDEPAAGKLTFTLYDSGKVGRWSNRIPGGVNFRKLGRNTPVRVSVDGDVRCVMEIPDWNPRWELNGAKVRVPVVASGIIRRLTEGARALRSPLYRDVMAADNAVYRVGYWPMEEGAAATRLANVVAPRFAGTVSDTSQVSFASYAAPGSAPMLTLGAGASIHLPVPEYTAPASEHKFVAVWAIPDAGLTDQTVMQRMTFVSGGTIRSAELLYATSNNGCLQLRVKDSAGTTLHTSGLLTVPDGLDGAHFLTSTEIYPSGVNVERTIVIAPIDATDPQDSLVYTNTIATQTLGARVSAVDIFPNGDGTEVSVGHGVMVNDRSGLGAMDSAVIGHAGETAGNRIERLLTEEGVAFAAIGDLDDTPAMGIQLQDTLMANLQAARRTDQGLLFETRTELGLTYRTIKALYNAPGPAVDYAAQHITPEVEPTEDITPVRNYVVAKRPDGSSALSTLTEPSDANHRLSTQAPPDGVGTYDRGDLDVQSFDDDWLQHAADWVRHLGTWDEYRYPTLTFELEADPLAGTALAAALAALIPGDRLTVDNLPVWLPPDLVCLQVRGRLETIGTHTRTLTFNLAPGWPWEVWQVESGGATLVVARDTDDTSWKIATSAGPPFKTGAPLAVPYYVQAAGEAVKVTTMATDTPALIGTGSGSTANGGNTTPGMPGGITADAGQLLTLFAFTDGAAATVDTPAGWSLKAGTASGKLRVFTRYYVTGVAAPTVTYTGDAAGDINASFISAWSGLSDQLDDGRYRARYPSPQRQVNSSAANIATPPLSVRRNNGVVFAVGARTEDWTSVATLSGFTGELLELDDGTGNRAGIVADYLLQTTATDVAANAFVVTGGVNGAGESLIFALRPLQTATVVRGVNGSASPAAGETIYGWRLGVLGL